MRFVNMSTRPVFNTFSGSLNPGEVSADGGPYRVRLEKALSDVVNACGGRLGIKLNEREAKLIDALVTLDEKGRAFNKSSLPEEIRNDPTGEKKREAMEDEAQRKGLERITKANEDKARREAIINGETEEPRRRPAGPAAMEGEKVDPSALKSGFERIMEENARIAAGDKPEMDVNEALDPIGAHMKKCSEEKPAEERPESIGKEATPPESASGRDDDVAKTADAAFPVPKAQNPKNAMDRQAAEMAGNLSVLSVLDNPPAKGKGRGRTKKAKQ